MNSPVFLKNLQIRNFRSVRSANVSFDNPLFLVGRNGSGKSNFVDAIAFLADCVNLTLKAAVEKRGGLERITYIGSGSTWPFIECKADVTFADRSSGSYLLRLKIENHNYSVDSEECFINRNGETHFFKRNGGDFETSVPGLNPRLGAQNLALPLVGGIEEFAFLADGFSTMCVYHIDYREIRPEKGVEASAVLNANGENVAGVLRHLHEWRDNESLRVVHAALRSVAPAEIHFEPVSLKDGTFSMIGTQQKALGFGAVDFDRGAFSDGTLHALGLAVALNQNPPPSVIVIEEPENNLHPGALAAISDLIKEASRKTQVIITTHSPDLLDAKWIKPENLRVVTWENDASRVSEIAERPQKALQEHLMYAGQLMRANALEAAPAETAEQAAPDNNPVTAAP